MSTQNTETDGEITEINAEVKEVAKYFIKPLSEIPAKIPAGEFAVRKIERSNGKVSSFVLIPAITSETLVVALDNDVVLSAAVEWFSGITAEVVKAAMAKHATSKIITADEFSLAAVVEYLEEQQFAGGQISADRLGKWFDSVVSPIVTLAVERKFAGKEVAVGKKAQAVASFRKVFVSLADDKTKLAADAKLQVEKILEKLESSAIQRLLNKKLNPEVVSVDLEALEF